MTERKLPPEDLEELERDEPVRTEDEEFEILAELETAPAELPDPAERARYEAFLAKRKVG